jgi:membrane fusion protein, multidrug efflux system
VSDNVKSKGPAASKRLFLTWIGLAVMTVVIAAGIVFARQASIVRQTSALAQAARQGPVVLVTRLIQQPASRELTLPAEIHGYYETPIYAKINGYVKTMLVDKGALVKAGQLVATIESPETDQQVRDARASYEIAAITDRRYQALLRTEVIPKQTADTYHASMLEALATWKSDQATQSYERVTAPFDGMITARNLDPGALVGNASAANTSTPSLFQIATLKPVRAYVYMPQSIAPFVKDGDQATVTVSEYARRVYSGVITRHPSALDQSTRTMQIEVDLPNDDISLYPGMFANVALRISGSNGAPRVPDQALIFNDDKVLIPVVSDSRIHLAEVTLGYDDGINCEVNRGLKGDETIALGMGQAAEEGELVRPLTMKGH